jgi:hypothetical protein
MEHQPRLQRTLDAARERLARTCEWLGEAKRLLDSSRAALDETYNQTSATRRHKEERPQRES